MNLDTTSVALDNPSIQFPLIHMNGNSAMRLGNEYFEALKALRAFEKEFEKIEFHQRDYYPLGDEAWVKARAQRQTQWANIGSIRHYLEAHASHCFESAK
jgi:hypothetical protein